MTHIFKKHPLAAAMATLLVTGSLAGCGTVRNQVNELESKATGKIIEEHGKAAQPIPVVTRTPAAWLMGQTVQIVPPPSPILTKKLTYNPTQRVSLSDVAAYIYEKTGLPVDTAEVWGLTSSGATSSPQSGLAPQPAQQVVPSLTGQFSNVGAAAGSNALNSPQLLAIDYEGTLSGLLDVVANKSGVWWKFSDGRVTFYRTETKTFYIPAIANKSTGGSSISANSAPSSGSSSGGSTAVGSSSSSSSTGGTSSNSTYNVDIWGDLEKTAKTVGGTAQVVTNSSVGSVTVTGTPTQVRNVEEWVKSLSDNLSQQVAITVHVYKVKVTSEDNYNWNPSVVFNSLSGQFGITLTGPQTPSVVSGSNPMNLTARVLQTATGAAAPYSGSQFAYQALSTIGRVTETVKQTVVTLNGQPVPVQVADIDTYLQSTTQAPAGPIGSAPLPPTLTPGTITTGFTAMFLPKIVNGKVLLAMNMTSSTLNSIGSAVSGGSRIDTPRFSLSTFQQSASLTPGDALLLTGLQQGNGKSNRSGVGSPDNYLLGGGLDDNAGKQLTAIVISAKVL